MAPFKTHYLNTVITEKFKSTLYLLSYRKNSFLKHYAWIVIKALTLFT